jgi:hypothetical protein
VGANTTYPKHNGEPDDEKKLDHSNKQKPAGLNAMPRPGTSTLSSNPPSHPKKRSYTKKLQCIYHHTNAHASTSCPAHLRLSPPQYDLRYISQLPLAPPPLDCNISEQRSNEQAACHHQRSVGRLLRIVSGKTHDEEERTPRSAVAFAYFSFFFSLIHDNLLPARESWVCAVIQGQVALSPMRRRHGCRRCIVPHWAKQPCEETL